MSIIGISGNKDNGKKTVADYLVEKYGFIKIGFADAIYEECRECRIEYIRKLNIIVTIYLNGQILNIFNYNQLPEYFQDWLVKDIKLPTNITISYEGMTEKDPILMQWWGTDFRRKYFGEDYWVNIMKLKLVEEHRKYFEKGSPDEDFDIVIPDVRFKNEFQMIKDSGGEVWDVIRFNRKRHYEYDNIQKITTNKTYYVSPDRDPNHPSETDLDGAEFDQIIEAETGDLKSIYKQLDTLRIIGEK